MKILVRGNKMRRWEFADPVATKAETELQHLLIESPSLIPISDIREGISPLVIAVDEFGLPGSGNTDLLAFTADGDIAIIECKLATNPDSKRKVIGQILEYGSFLWGMSYQEVDRRIQGKRGKPLTELVEEAVAGGWDEEGFRSGVEHSLERGAFLLIIVVDEINEQLRRIIRYVNECSKSEFSLHALEIRRFRADVIEVLVPHLHGVSTKPPVMEGRRKKWTEDAFFSELAKRNEPHIMDIVKDLYQWSEKTADRIWFGTGIETGSFTLHFLKEGKTVSVFTIYTDGRFVLNYGWLSPQLSSDIMQEFHSKVTALSPFSRIPADFSKWHSIRIAEAFKSPEYLESFKQVVEWLHSRIETQ